MKYHIGLPRSSRGQEAAATTSLAWLATWQCFIDHIDKLEETLYAVIIRSMDSEERFLCLSVETGHDVHIDNDPMS